MDLSSCYSNKYEFFLTGNIMMAYGYIGSFNAILFLVFITLQWRGRILISY